LDDQKQNFWKNKNTECLEKQKHKIFGENKNTNVWKNINTNVWKNMNTKCQNEQKHKMFIE